MDNLPFEQEKIFDAAFQSKTPEGTRPNCLLASCLRKPSCCKLTWRLSVRVASKEISVGVSPVITCVNL